MMTLRTSNQTMRTQNTMSLRTTGCACMITHDNSHFISLNKEGERCDTDILMIEIYRDRLQEIPKSVG